LLAELFLMAKYYWLLCGNFQKMLKNISTTVSNFGKRYVSAPRTKSLKRRSKNSRKTKIVTQNIFSLREYTTRSKWPKRLDGSFVEDTSMEEALGYVVGPTTTTCEVSSKGIGSPNTSLDDENILASMRMSKTQTQIRAATAAKAEDCLSVKTFEEEMFKLETKLDKIEAEQKILASTLTSASKPKTNIANEAKQPIAPSPLYKSDSAKIAHFVLFGLLFSIMATSIAPPFLTCLLFIILIVPLFH
jgi:hypothetical protein